MTASPPAGSATVIDGFIADQQRLTAVERFAQRAAVRDAAATGVHRDLIPLTAPGPGEQYAFEVDLDKCSGCKSCVSACHSLNGLDESEMWRGVGLLVSGAGFGETGSTLSGGTKRGTDFPGAETATDFGLRVSEFGLLQHITAACHHCVDPGCLNGCPVLAYDKDPVTGIVRHLDDQCIGCQYCVMKCPYDVPKYSARRGIVRKCDLCHNRLAAGEAPACAQACPGEAIRVALVQTKEIEARYRRTDGELPTPASIETKNGHSRFSESDICNATPAFLPDSPDPRITLPTTRYVSRRPLPQSLMAGNHRQVEPADAHWPLASMLVLTQLSVGTAGLALFLQPTSVLPWITASTGIVALAVASMHLGRPLKAWRAFLGWRRSWFSREVIAFGGFVPLAVLYAAAASAGWLAPLREMLALAVAGAGLAGVACSAMIYADTRREFWRTSQSVGKFFGTTLLLGAATALVGETWTRSHSGVLPPLIALLAMGTVGKLGFEHRIFRHWTDANTTTLKPLNRTARLLAGELGIVTRLRIACGILGGIVLPVILIANRETDFARATVLAILIICGAGELLERSLFFRAVAPARMPGGVAA